MAGKRAAQVVVDPIAAGEQLGKKIPDGPDASAGSTSDSSKCDFAELQDGLDPADSQASPAPGLLQRVHDAGGLAHAEDPEQWSEPKKVPLGKDPSLCALGHRNELAARFCAECGLSMSAQAPPPPVRLEDARPKPVSELSAAERAERDRQHLEALAAARQFENAPVAYVPSEGTAVLVHFIEDGLTAFGQVWYRGQEIEIGPGHPRWEQARAWILLDRPAQIDRWGKQFFAPGPWPGRQSYLDGADAFEQLASDGGGKFRGPGEQALRQADEAERRRGRAVPASLR